MAYDESGLSLSIEANATTKTNSGDYQIKLQLIDALGVRSDWQQVKLSIISPEEAVDAEGDSDTSANDQVVDAAIGAKYAA